MGREIKELNNDILRITQNVVVHTPIYSKFGGYDGERDIYTMDIATALYNAGYRKQEWISVDERLPGIDELCLLCMENKLTKHRRFVIAYFHAGFYEYVTHWMPLPEAPKMKGGASNG